MASEELVTEQFQFLGINVEQDVLRKCVSLCQEYNVDAETLIEQWMAFSLTHLNGAPPTIDYLDLLERKEFSKRAADGYNVPGKGVSLSNAGTSVTIYGASALEQSDNEVLSDYGMVTPKRVKTEPVPQNELCPATYSPNIGHSDKYASRSNGGTVVHSFGDDKLLQKLATANGSLDMLNINVTQVPNDDGELYNKAMFGFELLHEKATTFSNHIRYISQCIMKKAGIHESTSVRHKTQVETTVAGRIECDADARLNPKSVVLQGTWEESLSQAVPVDVDNLKHYSLFPGQVVVMRGINPRGNKFIAHELYHDASLPIPDHNADIMNSLKGELSLVVAAGPYTTSDNMTYEPLKDLISYIGVHRPHAVLMTGPFMDSDHAKVKDNSMAETYKSFFEKLIDSLNELNNTSPYTKIYIVSNIKDAFHVNIYPTPPYTCRKKNQNINFIPDPCTLNVSGIHIGITSVDILMQISQEEISLNCPGDKLARLAGHILSQQSYYPLWPAAIPVDAQLWTAHAQLPATPHLLILPSHFRYFVKEVNGCIVVNPERLTKGTGGGTFARILINGEKDLAKNIAAQIVRI